MTLSLSHTATPAYQLALARQFLRESRSGATILPAWHLVAGHRKAAEFLQGRLTIQKCA